jgi:hypothetical protein
MAIFGVDPNYTLDELNQFVEERETARQGPLTAIGNKDGKTIIEIDTLDPAGAPATPSKITTAGTPPAGARIIGRGKIYVSGTLTDATAYKPV